ncbi:MAG: DUF6094 domain-containing protein [bacterium]
MPTSFSMQKAKDQKKRLGQYFTGLRLARMLAKIAFAEIATNVIDPMAGDGDMLEAVAQLAPASNLYGIEYDSMYAKRVKHRLAENARIISGNAFCWENIARLGRHSFDLVITNPPYVRYQSLSNNKKDELPDANAIRLGLLDIIAKLPNLAEADRKTFSVLTKSYSGLSDMAVPSWLLCAMLVRPGGTLAMVAPEAWLTRDYSDCIRYLLLKYFRLRWVIDNEGRDWFDDAQVKTALLVAERLKKPRDLSNLISDVFYVHVSLKRKSGDNNSPVGCLFPKIDDPNEALRKMMTNVEKGNSIVIDNATISKRRLSSKLNDLLASSATSSWINELETWVNSQHSCSHVRSVKVSHAIESLLTNEELGRLCSLDEVGVGVGQGLRTGANNFFYCVLSDDHGMSSTINSKILPNETVSVPSEILMQVFKKQIADLKGFAIDADCLKDRVLSLDSFSPPETRTPERGRKLMPGGLKRLVVTAQNINVGDDLNPQFIPELSAVRTNVRASSVGRNKKLRYWYMLPPMVLRHRPDLFVARINNNHPKTILNPERRVVIDANFSTLWVKDGRLSPSVLAVLALMNSSWCIANMEQLATIMGGGALKLEATHLRKLPIPCLSTNSWNQLDLLGKKLMTSRSTNRTLDKIDHVVASAIFGPRKAKQALIAINKIKSQSLEARKNDI